MNKNYRLSAGWTIFGFIVLAIITPFIFTRNGLTWLDFTHTGPIGDTIGGLTAPIVGVLNAVLLYITLKRQDEQLKEQRIEIEIDRKTDSVRYLIKELRFKVSHRDPYTKEFLPPVEYKSHAALSVAMTMFSAEKQIIPYYHMDAKDWMEFSTDINQIIVNSIYVLNKNLHSNKNKNDKLSIFYDYKFVIVNVLTFVDEIKNYEKTYQHHSLYPNLFIDHLVKYHFDVLQFKP